MNAIDKLRSLQAGELDKVLPDIYVGTPWSKTLYPICKINAAKVEVTKVVLPVFEAALTRAKSDMEGWQAYVSDYFKDKHDAADDLAAIDQALTLLQQLKESL
jgi:hypothetical protein